MPLLFFSSPTNIIFLNSALNTFLDFAGCVFFLGQNAFYNLTSRFGLIRHFEDAVELFFFQKMWILQVNISKSVKGSLIFLQPPRITTF